MTELQQKVADLLMIIWRGIPLDYKRKYLNIWEQFEANIRSAAYTSSLGKFINSLCLKMNADIGKNANDRSLADKILAELPARETLKLLREETTLLVLMVHVANQEKRAAWEAERADEEMEVDFENS